MSFLFIGLLFFCGSTHYFTDDFTNRITILLIRTAAQTHMNLLHRHSKPTQTRN